MLNKPFDPETRIVSRADQPPMLERACDLCVVGSGASGWAGTATAGDPATFPRLAGLVVFRFFSSMLTWSGSSRPGPVCGIWKIKSLAV